MTTSEHGAGTIRAVRSKKTGEIIGYQALLPRELSRPRRGSGRVGYQEPVGPPCATKEEARRVLDAVLYELKSRGAVRHGLPFSSYVEQELRAAHTEARRRYGSLARANKACATARSIDRRWLSKASFYDYPPAAIQLDDLQRWIDQLRDEAEGLSGEPLSSSFVRIGGANLARALELPAKDAPSVRYLELPAQRAFFASSAELSDRVMVGCGMGPGLRVGELLSFEIDDVHLDDHDPYLIVRYGGDHHAPTKGGRVRRVELYEPALGFWRLWLGRFYAGGRRVFAGPAGGYLKAWPENFPGWAQLAGVDRLSSHIMRHTYAVAMLSGTWGYEPRSLEFVSKQLGHADVQTTERYYGAYEFGVWQREVRRMTGRDPVRPLAPVTAAELLGLDASVEGSGSAGGGEKPPIALVQATPPSSTQTQEFSKETGRGDASPHHVLALLEGALVATRDGEPHAARRLVEAAGAARELLLDLLAERRAGHG
jgi:integrase